jgi:hypothetical protein
VIFVNKECYQLEVQRPSSAIQLVRAKQTEAWYRRAVPQAENGPFHNPVFVASGLSSSSAAPFSNCYHAGNEISS